MNEIDYKPDFEISDRYISFSAELLRLSLLGISGFAGLLVLPLKAEDKLSSSVKMTLFISILFLAITSGLALAHRFFATDSMSYHIAFLRKNSETERIGRGRLLKKAEWSLILAEYTFAIGILLFAFSIYQFLFVK